MFKDYRRLWMGLGALIVLSPLGLVAVGTAYGEWKLDQLMDEMGFVPAGLERMADFWQHAPLANYGIAGFNSSFIQSAAGYVLSGVAGILLIVGIVSLLSKMVKE